LLIFRIASEFLDSQKTSLNFSNNYGLEVDPDNYPLSSTPKQGLKLTLNENENVWFIDVCSSPSFTVHSPFELPGSYEKTEMIEYSYGYDLEILITPEIIRTDEDLRRYDPVKRGCYFEGEKKLKYFKVYTKRNCEFECLAYNLHHTWSLNCTPYYMPRSKSMEHCDYRHEYYIGQKTLSIVRNLPRSKNDHFVKCLCLDACDTVKYKTEIIAYKQAVKVDDDFYIQFSYTTASFEFKFKDVDIVTLRRYQPFTFSEFLAQAGGMLGLFAGISVLSIIELIYFMTLRWIVNLWRWIKKKLMLTH
jgi:acid-sensing ion channel, other